MRMLVLVFFFGTHLSLAQYWQQRVDYVIDCTLDDRLHQLSGVEKIVYHNHSPDTLHLLKIHTWMNAFGSHPSPFEHQLAKLGSYKKQNLTKADEGGYITLQCEDLGQELQYSFDDPAHEIMTLHLQRPILPGATLEFEIHFKLDIPKNISRGGHLGQSYQMTQWYPKVALYDSIGWHTMPYLEFGEYYNDFGDYEVTIRIPSNYIVAASGVLQTAGEYQQLMSYADSCAKKILPYSTAAINYTPTSSTKTKALQFSAHQVTDFAWFADKRFLVNHKTITIEENPVDVWTYFLPEKLSLWPQAVHMTAKAVQYYSKLVGVYPYPQISIVACDRYGTDATGAMEYPMIAMFDGLMSDPVDLETTIVHEVGHNWFQAILASDERTEPWMDEGLVTYYEHRYFGNKISNSFLSGGSFFTQHSDYVPIPDFLWYLQASFDADAPSNWPALKYSSKGYALSIYEKPAKGFRMIEKYLGIESFDRMMRQFFETWKFRHPRHHHLISALKTHNITWFDSLYIFSNAKQDIKILATDHRSIYQVHHSSAYAIPIEIAGYHQDKLVFSHVKMINNLDTILLPSDSIQYLIVDPNFLLPEIRREDNIIRIRPTAFAPRKKQFHFLTGIGHSLIQDHYVTPAMGYNFYDGLMLGGVLHNLTLPLAPFTYAGMIGYGLKSKKPVLLASLEFAPKWGRNHSKQLSFGAELRNFSSYRDLNYNFQNRYFKFAPKLRWSSPIKDQTASLTEWTYRPIYIRQTYGEGIDFDAKKFELKSLAVLIHELKWHRHLDKSIYAFDLQVVAEKSKGMAKLWTQYQVQIPYGWGIKKYGEVRLFGGIQSNNGNGPLNTNFLSSGLTGVRQYQRDYKMDELFLGRSEESNSLSQQIFVKDAGLNSVADGLASDRWMLSASFRSMIPGFLPLRPYVQAALFPSPEHNITLSYTSGVSLVVLKNIMEINFPALESKNITQSMAYQNRSSYLKKCTFTLNLTGFNPFNWLKYLSR